MLLSQYVNPALQDVTLHCPVVQAEVPFATEQAVPQVPQFARSDCRFVSHPLLGLWSQSPKPAAQAKAHVPELQLWPDEVLGRTTQFVPQLPQLPGSRLVFSQIPLQEVSLVGQASVSPALLVRYSTVKLVFEAGFPVGQTVEVRNAVFKFVPAGKVRIPLPESASV